jgi:drug/metabolite transporter (DMT)-like permease
VSATLKMGAQHKAYLYASITVLLWSTVASAFKLTLRYLEPVQLLLYASLVSSMVLSLILLAKGKISILFSYSSSQYLQSLRVGILNPFLYYIVLFKAYALLPAQVAQPLNYTWAITLAYLSVPLLKQKIGIREIVAGIVCYLGVVVISTRGGMVSFSSFDLMGVVLALGSTVIWALSWILNTRDDRDPIACLLLSFLFSLPFIFVTCMLFSTISIPEPGGLLGAAYVGIFEMGITFVFWLKALKLSDNTAKVGNLIFLSPFLSLIFIHFIVGEKILPATIIGLVFIVTGLTIQSMGKR